MPNVGPAPKTPNPNYIHYVIGDLYWDPSDLTDPVSGYGTWLGTTAAPIDYRPGGTVLPISDETFGDEVHDQLRRGINPMIFALLAEHSPKVYDLGFAGFADSNLASYRYSSREMAGKLSSAVKYGKLLFLPYDRDNHNCILLFRALPILDSQARLVKALQQAEVLPLVFQGVRDPVGNVVQEALLADLAVLALAISNIVESGITASAATIAWDTNRAATSRVKYGTTLGGPYGSSAPNPVVYTSFATSHSVNLTGLSSATTYYYVVESYDADGNYAVSAEGSFVTA